jgi:hypothetical protein
MRQPVPQGQAGPDHPLGNTDTQAMSSQVPKPIIPAGSCSASAGVAERKPTGIAAGQVLSDRGRAQRRCRPVAGPPTAFSGKKRSVGF